MKEHPLIKKLYASELIQRGGRFLAVPVELVNDIARTFQAPIPLVLFCPACGLQHVDKEKPCEMGVGCREAGVCFASAHGEPDRCLAWDNPPHRSHLCDGCGCIWRPADVPTVGVLDVLTRGGADWQRQQVCFGGATKRQPCPGCGSCEPLSEIRARGKVACCPDRPGASSFIEGFEK